MEQSVAEFPLALAYRNIAVYWNSEGDRKKADGYVAKALIGMAQALVKEHGGEVPADMDALVQLPGVGRKTANVVLGHALGVPGLPVDRHVLRVSNRIGIVRSLLGSPSVIFVKLRG